MALVADRARAARLDPDPAMFVIGARRWRTETQPGFVRCRLPPCRGRVGVLTSDGKRRPQGLGGRMVSTTAQVRRTSVHAGQWLSSSISKAR